MNFTAEMVLPGAHPALQKWVNLATEQSEKVRQLDTRLQELDTQLQRRDSQLKTARITIEALTLELAHLRRIRFGSKNEALSAEQRRLFDEAVDEDIAAIEATTEAVLPPESRPPRARAGRPPLP